MLSVTYFIVILSVIILSDIMLNVIMLNVIVLNVIMLSVLLPLKEQLYEVSKIKQNLYRKQDFENKVFQNQDKLLVGFTKLLKNVFRSFLCSSALRRKWSYKKIQTTTFLIRHRYLKMIARHL
jgi:hypothetical protein